MLIFLQKQKNPPEYLDKCKNNTSKPQFLPSEVRVALEQMAMEQGLYAQVMMICLQDFGNKKEKGKTNKYNLQR